MAKAFQIPLAVNDIIDMVNQQSFVKISIDGGMGSGKSTLAKTLSYLIPKLSNKKFSIRCIRHEDLNNLTKTMINLKPGNHILVLDLMPYLSSTHYDLLVKAGKDFDTFRHVSEFKDKKIILINISHLNLLAGALGRFHAYFFTGLTPLNTDHVFRILGKESCMISKFKQVCKDCTIDGKFDFGVGSKVFDYKKPFTPALFYNALKDSVSYALFSKTRFKVPGMIKNV